MDQTEPKSFGKWHQLDRDGASTGSNGDDGLDESAIKTAKKILQDYTSQIQHLQKELEMVRKDLSEVEKSEGD
jgi:nuclear pore complex protein Nup54